MGPQNIQQVYLIALFVYAYGIIEGHLGPHLLDRSQMHQNLIFNYKTCKLSKNRVEVNDKCPLEKRRPLQDIGILKIGDAKGPQYYGKNWG